jgi:hypothetical protein
MGHQMEIFGHSHALRAVILACSMAWFGPAADLAATEFVRLIGSDREISRGSVDDATSEIAAQSATTLSKPRFGCATGII